MHRVVQSELLAKPDLDAVIAGLPVKNRSPSVNDLASELVKQKKLTLYQTQEICAGRGNNLVLGNYVVMEKLGDGGMGLVVKANHRRMDRTVALKLLSPELTKTPEAVGRFHREAKAAAKLDHQNIVTAYDADECRGTHFLVMQYVDGSDLSAIVRNKGPLNPDFAVGCIAQAARGLQYAHSRGVVHRDIKPSNLLLDADGSVRVLDMGLARIDTESTDQDPLTGTGMIMGTVDFMAPEQAVDSKTVDGRADIYSLGATLWFLLTGRVMYESDTMIKKLMSHQNSPIPALREACPSASPELERVFLRMVAKDADDRYPSMREVIDALSQLPGSTMAGGTRSSTSAAQTTQTDSTPRELLAGLQPDSAAHAVAMPHDDGSEPPLDVTVSLQTTQQETERAVSAPRLVRPRSKTLKSPKQAAFPKSVAIYVAAGIVIMLLASLFLVQVL